MTPRLLLLAALLTAALILCGIAYPAHYLACCGILAGLKLWWDCWSDTRSYRKDHNL